MNLCAPDQHESMHILVAEDEEPISETYLIALEDRGHIVTLTSNGDEALKEYKKRFNVYAPDKKKRMQDGTFPFDTVILDYRMPKKDGLEVAKEILEINPNQRIIFASAYVQATLMEAVKGLKRVVELLPKPFELDTLIDTIEDRPIYEELCKINSQIGNLEEYNPTHQELQEMAKNLKKVSKDNALVKALSEPA